MAETKGGGGPCDKHQKGLVKNKNARNANRRKGGRTSPGEKEICEKQKPNFRDKTGPSEGGGQWEARNRGRGSRTAVPNKGVIGNNGKGGPARTIRTCNGKK